MSAKKKSTDLEVASGAPAARSLLNRLTSICKLAGEPLLRRAAALLVIVAGAGILGAAAWWKTGERVKVMDEYQVPAEQVVITPAPTWLRKSVDVHRDVLRDASLEGHMSLLDERLTIDVARAFALHPWVAEVREVRKSFPARLEVKLDYRRPVCVVERTEATYVVDREGILLSRKDIAADVVKRLPRLQRVDAPRSLAGTVWNDSRVTGGALVAAALVDVWQQLRLRAITPSEAPVTTPTSLEFVYKLTTQSGRELNWGFAPGAEVPGEPSVKEKLARLTQIIGQEQQAVVMGNGAEQAKSP